MFLKAHSIELYYCLKNISKLTSLNYIFDHDEFVSVFCDVVDLVHAVRTFGQKVKVHGQRLINEIREIRALLDDGALKITRFTVDTVVIFTG